MFRNEQSISHDDQASSQQASNEMRVLTTEELREVVGGPDIQNGGSVSVATTNVTSSTGG